MEAAAKPHRTAAQLVAAAGKHVGQQGLWRTVEQRYGFLLEAGAAIGVGEQDGLGEMGHGFEAGREMEWGRLWPTRPCGDGAGDWATMALMRILHTMLRVGNLQRSIDFYTQVIGMKLLRTSENPEYQYTLAFVGFGNNPDHAELELTYNWGVESYDMGTAYGHIALGMTDIYAACERIKAAGGNVTREPGPVKGGTTQIAFVTDPDGYKVELIQRLGAC